MICLLSKEFEMKITDLKYYLGIEICKNGEDLICLSQSNYVKQVLNKFQMSECRPVKTPIESMNDCENNINLKITDFDYNGAVGSLMYLAVVSRPDIMFSVSYASRFLKDPK